MMLTILILTMTLMTRNWCLNQVLIVNMRFQERPFRPLLGFTMWNVSFCKRDIVVEYSFNGNLNESFKLFTKEIANMRISELYHHHICTEACKARGCRTVWSADGIWGIKHPHCMWFTKSKQFNKLGGHLPPVCLEEPLPCKSFCEKHSAYIEQLGMPTQVSSFIRACGLDPKSYDKDSAALVSETLEELAQDIEEEDVPLPTITTNIINSTSIKGGCNINLWRQLWKSQKVVKIFLPPLG